MSHPRGIHKYSELLCTWYLSCSGI